MIRAWACDDSPKCHYLPKRQKVAANFSTADTPHVNDNDSACQTAAPHGTNFVAHIKKKQVYGVFI